MGMEKKALFVATVGGFVTQFEMENVSLLQELGYEVHSAANFREPVYSVKEQELKEKGGRRGGNNRRNEDDRREC